MYDTKDAMLSYVHHDYTGNHVFCAYPQAFGRRFDEDIRRGKEGQNIKYIRAHPREVAGDSETKNLYVWYDDKGCIKSSVVHGGVKGMEVDMVVTSVAFVPPEGTGEPAKVLGVETDEYDFLKAGGDLLARMDTNRPGIYVAGACTGPMDVAGAVTRGGGAADRSAQAIEEFARKGPVKAGTGR